MNTTKTMEKETIDNDALLLWEHALSHPKWSSRMIEIFSNKYLRSPKDKEPARLAELMVVSNTLRLIGKMYREQGYARQEAFK